MDPTFLETLTLAPEGLAPVGMMIAGDPPSGTPPVHPVLVGVIRPPVAMLPFSSEQMTAIFTAAHAAYPA